MLKNFRENWKTSLMGIILAVTTLLVILGLITADQSGGLQEQGGVILAAIEAIVGAIAAIILMFKAKDA